MNQNPPAEGPYQPQQFPSPQYPQPQYPPQQYPPTQYPGQQEYQGQQYPQQQYPGQQDYPAQYPAQQYPPPQAPTQPGFPPQMGFQGPVSGPPGRLSRSQIVIGAVGGVVLLLIGVIIGNAVGGGGTAQPAPTVTVTASAGAGSPQPSGSANGGASNVIYTFSGNGSKNSPQFLVPSSNVSVKYTYDCTAYGMQGNFIAHMIGGNPSNGMDDYLPIANDLTKGGTQTTTIYPRDAGYKYHLEVISECSWTLTLTKG